MKDLFPSTKRHFNVFDNNFNAFITDDRKHMINEYNKFNLMLFSFKHQLKLS